MYHIRKSLKKGLLMNNYSRFILFIASISGSAALFSTDSVVNAASDPSNELIEMIHVEKNKITAVINSSLKEKYLKEDFFIEYDDDIDLSGLDYSIVSMPCIMNLISLVWISGKDYYINSMDRDLFYSLIRLKRLFKVMYPRTEWNGNLIPKKIVLNKLPFTVSSYHKALLFSGGLDSTSTSFAHHNKKQLLITAWGQWDLPLKSPETWTMVKKRIVDFAKENGHSCSFIKSNYFDFLNRFALNRLSKEIFNWRIGTIEDIGWAGMTAPLLFIKGYPTLSIAGSDTWNMPYPAPSATSPFIDSNIRCAGICINHEQYELSRADKVEFVVNECKSKGLDKPFLTVCPKQTGHNCGECKKCLMTIATLWALKEDPKEYGFSITYQEMIARMKVFMNSIFSKENLWLDDLQNIYGVQCKLQELAKKDIQVDSELKALFDFDFHEELVKTNEFKYQKKMSWDELHTLFPHIGVPEKYLHSKQVA